MNDIERLVESYRMSKETLVAVQKTRLLLVAGVVGGGKNTVIDELLKSDEYHPIVSHTTRPPRVNHGVVERTGVDYHFVSQDEAVQLIREQAFVEVKYVHGNIYGTSARELRAAHDSGKIAIADVDIQGVLEYLRIKSDTHAIFLLPPSVEAWLLRLEHRYGNLDEHESEILKRFRTAYDEIMHIMEDPRFIVVINDDLKTTVERVRSVIDGTVDHTSDYAEAVTEHLLDFLKSKL